MTAEGFADLVKEIEFLETVERPKIVERIKIAREWGDLKENAEYHDAKNSQAHLETRILQLRERQETAEIVEIKVGDTVDFGSTVELRDETTGKEITYQLVASRDASAAKGLLSFESPVATALHGLRKGDVATVTTPRGERRLHVIAVR